MRLFRPRHIRRNCLNLLACRGSNTSGSWRGRWTRYPLFFRSFPVKAIFQFKISIGTGLVPRHLRHSMPAVDWAHIVYGPARAGRVAGGRTFRAYVDRASGPLARPSDGEQNASLASYLVRWVTGIGFCRADYLPARSSNGLTAAISMRKANEREKTCFGQ